MNRCSLFRGRWAGTACEKVRYLAIFGRWEVRSGKWGWKFTPRNDGLVSVEFQGLRERSRRTFRSGTFSILFRSVLACFPAFFITPQTLSSLIYGAGCALLIVRLVWALATPPRDVVVSVPRSRRAALPLRNRQRGSGKTRSRNQGTAQRSEHGGREETKWVLNGRAERASM